MKRILPICLLTAGLFACTFENESQIVAVQGPALPHPVSNNAVAGFRSADGFHLLSLMGLAGGRGWQNVASEAWHLPPGSDAWQRLPDVPGGEGRLAGTAATVAGDVYVFGGYTVAEDGSERSVAKAYRLDTERLSWHELEPMPVPVDDAVSVVYLDRYVYLVSGWHDLGNVNLVQIYDVEEDAWRQATPWPGEAVFGHAGGIVGNRMLVCDGVAVRLADNGKRRFETVDACYLGKIDADDIRRIHWQVVAPHPGSVRYRIAATGTATHDGEIVFAGGSGNAELTNDVVRPFIEDREARYIGCWAITEPNHGSDTLAVGTQAFRDPNVFYGVTARADGDEWVISGQKSSWVVNGTIATHALTFLGIEEERGSGMAGGGVALVPL
ncbi:MAG: hypothetical protein IH835_02110, partial [Proteobacteria bacterium]|nr:hypothetical protein [Pseudomonadota bacterium]